MVENHPDLLTGHGDLKLDVVSSNILAGTWIMGAVFSGFDHGVLGEPKNISMKKGKNSFDLSIIISIGPAAISAAISIVLYLKKETNERIRHEELLQEMKQHREELLPITRALKYVFLDKKARIDEVKINDIELTKDLIDPASFRQLRLDDYESDDKKYLK